MTSLGKVVKNAVGSLDEAGLSSSAMSGAVVSLAKTSLQSASEITKGSEFAGDSVGAIAAAAISGMAAANPCSL